MSRDTVIEIVLTPVQLATCAIAAAIAVPVLLADRALTAAGVRWQERAVDVVGDVVSGLAEWRWRT